MSKLKNLWCMGMWLLITTPALAQTPEPINAQNELAYRASLGRADDITLMIKQGANPNSTSKEGLPLLLVAANRKDPEAVNAVRALLDGGAQINSKDTLGQTALYYAARNGNKGMTTLLLERNIDYYSLDNTGNIARTIAFRAGHADIVQMMDDFVKAQTLKLKGIEIPAAQNIDNVQRAEKEAAKQAALRAKKAHEKELKAYQENTKLLPSKIHDMSYAACAFQYWSYVQATRQTIPLSDEQLEETIAIHKNEVREEALDIMRMFKVGHDYVNQVIHPSKQRIFDMLEAMPSRTYRKENGVGTPKDADKRCLQIADIWNISPPKNPQRAEEKKSPVPTQPRAQSIQKPKPNQRLFPNQTETVPVGAAALPQKRN